MGASDEGRRCGKLEQLIEAILKWLKQAGFAAVRRLPEGVFPALTDTVVAVGIRKAEAKDAGLYSYLGVLTISRICAEECRFAADADCYSCKVTAHALAYVYALANEEETEFTDFILKGEVQ